MSRRKPPTPDSLVSRRALARLLRPASIAVIAACVLVPAIPAAAAAETADPSPSPSAIVAPDDDATPAETGGVIIRVDGEAPEGGEVGRVVVMPGASASDVDGSADELVVAVTDPEGVVTMLSADDAGEYRFTPSAAGDYLVAYSVSDATGGVSEETRTVSVTGAPVEQTAAAPLVSAAPAVEADGPDVRFSAIGDIHDNWGELAEAYDFWKQENVQTALFVGDLTNSATPEEFDGLKQTMDAKAGLGIPAIASLGNHDVAGISSYDLFTQATGGQKPNADYTVNGYHVITVSPGSGTIDPDTGKPSGASSGNYAYAAAWLQQRLTAATAEDPTKPVMVLVHHPLQCTHYVSNEWYGTGLSSGCGDGFQSVFDDFPQAVVWGGHIHTPQNIPTSIWQGQENRSGERSTQGFTTVNAPPLAYYEFESGVVNSSPTSRGNDTTPDDAGDNRQTAIVEITGTVVTIKNYDLLADQWIDQTWTWDVAASVDETKTYDERFPFNNTLRASESAGPVWGSDAAVTVDEISGSKAMVSFPQATPAPNTVGDIVHKYRYQTVDLATGAEVNSFLQWSGFYNLPMPTDRRHEVWNLLPGREYEVRVTPINAWGKEGTALTARFTSGDSGEGEAPFDPSALTFDDLRAEVPSADLLDVGFADGVATDASPAARPLTPGADTRFEDDADVQAQVAVGAEGAATGIRTPKWTDDEYAALQDGFTLDATFRLDSISGSYVDVFGGMQSGGIGLEAVGTSATTYDLQFWYASPRPVVSLEYGQWYHVTAWYDGTDARLYVDGIRKTESEGVSFSVKPSSADARYMVIGGDANPSGSLDDSTMDGRVAGVEIYSDPLFDKDVYRVAMRELTSLDTMPPLLRVDPEPAGDAVVGTAYTAPAAEAVDNSGRVTAALEVTDPSGAPSRSVRASPGRAPSRPPPRVRATRSPRPSRGPTRSPTSRQTRRLGRTRCRSP
ncbi:LamG-like jellyroll fold domain-containing protein [Microbacterium sp. Se5.02b]|uniref:LamG-like jellyroll fold domain-containing protein n=1 Tax=Microbacterium sp. Se5.02b TaxID=2864103 RepID=UPI001C68FC34|nr:LamG-like jellyroll fold domain-containing protein [Microbacterium sp. Se5.02b]QYM63384.1 metallophosphoesterase [Microbacterium sp. Se5.02b]